jgi:hypothetical protein
MPLVYRVMGKDVDEKPIIADNGGLGVRIGSDISVDSQDNALETIRECQFIAPGATSRYSDSQLE